MSCEGFSIDVGSRYQLLLTLHAKRRMSERAISVEDILDALREPVQVYYDIMRDLYLVLGYNNVAVVVALRGTLVEVVTVLRRREYEALIGRLGRRRYRLIC